MKNHHSSNLTGKNTSKSEFMRGEGGEVFEPVEPEPHARAKFGQKLRTLSTHNNRQTETQL
jgi:hypothetical protein